MTNRLLRTEQDRRDVIAMLQALDLAKPWKVTVERPKTRRSMSQNNLFHLWVDEIARHFGYDPWDKETIKEELKRICDCPKHTIVGLDGTAQLVRKTSLLTTQEMADFQDRVYRFAATELNTILTIPESLHEPQKRRS